VTVHFISTLCGFYFQHMVAYYCFYSNYISKMHFFEDTSMRKTTNKWQGSNILVYDYKLLFD